MRAQESYISNSICTEVMMTKTNEIYRTSIHYTTAETTSYGMYPYA